ncbi:MAG TPA: hypothetical protein H9956_08980 [Candidatus Eisenbergiella pullicola]|nr:hypothetical protein [Candidatus Eisenbergiella pullicola]
MIVNIMTGNGHMNVDLDKFLPTTIPRIRKLFLMMREGTMKDDLDRVSGYLENRAKAAAEDLVGKTEELRREEERLAKMEQELVRLRELRNAEKKRITEMKREMSNDRKVVDQAPVWRKEFEYICGKRYY